MFVETEFCRLVTEPGCFVSLNIIYNGNIYLSKQSAIEELTPLLNWGPNCINAKSEIMRGTIYTKMRSDWSQSPGTGEEKEPSRRSVQKPL